METNIIINGNCIEELDKLPEESVDLIFADPPYWMRVEGVLNRPTGVEYDGCNDEWDNQFETNEDYKEFTKNWISACMRVLKPNGSFWVIGGMQCIYTIGAIMQDLGLWFINDVIWWKTNPTPNFKGTRINNAHETLIWATKSKNAKYTFNYKTAKELNTDTVWTKDFVAGIRRQLGSVWRIGVCQGESRLKDNNGQKLHSTQKPEEILYRIIALNSKIGDVVLDPFGGTMTTAAVAKKMGRNYIMIEASERYCKYGRQRLDSISEEITDIELATFDSKPPKVSFEEMIQAGYFKIREKLYYNGQPFFFLTENGKIVREGEEPMDIHSGIARLKKSNADRLNGWNFWMVSRGGQLVLINDIRQQYLKEVKKYG